MLFQIERYLCTINREEMQKDKIEENAKEYQQKDFPQ
jgi:hypothetical protein